MAEVQTLSRGLRILELLSEADGLTATEITDQLQVDKSSVSRLMQTLESHNFVERDEQTRRYYLGIHLQELAKRAGKYATLRDLTEPYLQHLGMQTSENAHVAVYSSAQALTIADVPSTETLESCQ